MKEYIKSLQCERCIYEGECPFYEDNDWNDCDDYVPADEFELGVLEYEKDLKERDEYYKELLEEQGWED